MIKNYLKIALRNLSKNKTYALINIFGLAVAFLCSTLLFLNAWFELSYDNYHPDKDRIFKLYHYEIGPEGVKQNGSMGYPVAAAVKNEIPQIEGSTRFVWSDGEVDYNGKKMDLQVNLVDDDFLSVFSIPVTRGNSANPMRELSNTVMTEYAATRLFGKTDPIGKKIKIKVKGEWKEMMVAAITKDFPENSSIKYDVLIRTEVSRDYMVDKDNWNHHNHDVYIKLASSVTPEAIEQKLSMEVLKKYAPEDTAYMKSLGYQKNSYGTYSALKLLPVTELHFNREVGSMNGATSKTYLYTILLISFFILAIACFNFINLNVARAFTRTKEVGVRKYMGASKKQIFLQIWGESLVICLIAVTIGLGAATFLFPEFNKLFAAKLNLSFFYRPHAIVMILSSLLIISLCAGGYPAMALSRFSISGVLKGNASLKKPGFFRNSLIVLQFTAACVLMACTLIAYQQFEYIRNSPLGYNKEGVISFPVSSSNGREILQRFRNNLSSQTSIVSITGADINLGLGKDGSTSKSSSGFSFKGKNISTNWMTVDYDFFKTLNINIIKGRDFSKAFTSDSGGSLVVTESMAKQFDGDPIGLTFSMGEEEGAEKFTIIGVIPDFHLYSLHEESAPLAINMFNDAAIRYVFVKTRGNNPAQEMKLVEDTYKKLVPGKEFRGSFLDENTDRWYQKEKRLSLLLGISAIIAVILSCLGLFALAMLMIRQRVKEIGVRKVLGASIFNINKLLTKDFLKLVVTSLVIAIPLSWWAMDQWLQDFPYRTTISWILFLGVGMTAIIISIATVSFHTIKAAMMNPVKSLRSE